MPRIVAGVARGRPLSVPARGTRPTSDRAREGLFSTLTSLLDLSGARVLDLYAGTGAVGLEALSRGATAATLVESSRTALGPLRRNVVALGLAGADVVARPVAAYLAERPDLGAIGLVFLDPPYALRAIELTAALAELAVLLAPETVLVVERSARGAGPSWPSVIESIKTKRYGDSVFWYGRRA
jgi:16S rRNA (guanine966-N2)-methyltransferase